MTKDRPLQVGDGVTLSTRWMLEVGWKSNPPGRGKITDIEDYKGKALATVKWSDAWSKVWLKDLVRKGLPRVKLRV